MAHSIKKQIIKCKIVRYSRDDDASEMQQSLRFGEVILNAIPEEITRYESPLNKDQIKYKIRFTTPFGESFITQPKSLDKIVSDPKIRSLTYKPRTAEESLNAILNGAQRAQRVSVVQTNRDSWLLLHRWQNSCVQCYHASTVVWRDKKMQSFSMSWLLGRNTQKYWSH